MVGAFRSFRYALYLVAKCQNISYFFSRLQIQADTLRYFGKWLSNCACGFSYILIVKNLQVTGCTLECKFICKSKINDLKMTFR